MTETSARPVPAPCLDDPVRFARELWSALAAGGDPRLVAPAGGAAAGLEAALRTLREVPPEEAAGEAVAEAAYAWGVDRHSAGLEFGVAAEQLRRALLAGAAGEDASDRAGDA